MGGTTNVEVAVVEQAKGVLMLRYGLGSYEALAVLVSWSREADVGLGPLCRALVHGVCQGRRHASRESSWLVRWLEQRMRDEVVAASPGHFPGRLSGRLSGRFPGRFPGRIGADVGGLRR